MAAKSLGHGGRVHSNLCACVVLSNTEWASQQTWRADISVAHRKIVSKYRYNHVQVAESICEVLRKLSTEDAVKDQRKAKAPGELADMVNQEMTRLQQLVQQHPEPPPYQSESNEESAHAPTTTDSKSPAP